MVDIQALRQQKLFSEMTDTELAVIVSMIVTEKYAKGSAVLKEGDPTKGIYLIQRGKVEISKITPDGWKQTLGFLGEHHFFGELSVIEDRQSHSIDALAIEDTDFFVLKKEDIWSLEEKDQTIMYKIMRAIARVASRNVRSMNEKFTNVSIS